MYIQQEKKRVCFRRDYTSNVQCPRRGDVMFWQEISLEGITARGSIPFYNSTGGDTEPECDPLKHR